MAGTSRRFGPCRACTTSGDGNSKAIEMPVDDRATPDWRCRLWQGMGWSSGTLQLQRTLNVCYLTVRAAGLLS
jgi:hypothetical protein